MLLVELAPATNAESQLGGEVLRKQVRQMLYIFFEENTQGSSVVLQTTPIYHHRDQFRSYNCEEFKVNYD